MPDSNKIKFNKVIGFSSSLDTEPYQVADSMWTRAEGIGFRKGLTTVLEGYTDIEAPTSKPTYLVSKVVNDQPVWFYTANSVNGATGELWSTTGASHTRIFPTSSSYSGTTPVDPTNLYSRVGEHGNVEFSVDENVWYNVTLNTFVSNRDNGTLDALASYIVPASTTTVTSNTTSTVSASVDSLPLFSLDNRPQISFLNGLIYLNDTHTGGLYVYTGSEWKKSEKYDTWNEMQDGVGNQLPLTNVQTKFKSIRPYKNFLIGMNIDEGTGTPVVADSDGNPTETTDTEYVGYRGEGSVQPSLIRWSDVQPDPNSEPSWDVRTPITLAGQLYAAETPDAIVDGLQLRDSFIIYKEESIYSLDFVGGTYVMTLSFLHDNYGLLAKDCAVNVEGYHFCVGKNKIYLNTGSEVQQIGDGFVDNLLFDTLRAGFEKRTFVTVDHRNTEVLIHYVSTDNTDAEPSTDKAIIWNYLTKAWSTKNTPSVTFAAYGVYDPQLDNNWDTDESSGGLSSWDNFNKIWNSNKFDASALYVLSISYAGRKMMVQDINGYRVPTIEGYDFALEKLEIDLDEDRVIKYVDRIVPHINGSGTISVRLGSSPQINSPVTWKPYQEYNLSESYSVDQRVSGRYLATSFYGVGVNNMRFYGFTFEGYEAGLR